MSTPEQTIKIKKRIKNTYLFGIFIAAMLVIAASGLACWINRQHFGFLRTLIIKIIQLCSIVPGAAALYGKKAIPEIWTTGANSPVEIYNDCWFNRLSSIGFFLAVWAFQLEPQ